MQLPELLYQQLLEFGFEVDHIEEVTPIEMRTRNLLDPERPAC